MATRTSAAFALPPILAALFLLCPGGCRDPRPAPVPPMPVPGAVAGTTRPAFDPARMAEADRLIEQAVARGDVPGAVLVVGRRGGVVYQKAYGSRAVQPQPEPMSADTIFDIASLTKPIATATSVMLLAERGKIDLNEKVAAYLPAFAQNGKDDVTVAELLLHTGGLIADNALGDYDAGPSLAMAKVYGLEPTSPAGTAFTYSDVGYIVLADLVRAVDGRTIDRFAREEIFQPLGMNDTAYLPPAAWKARSAPTEQRDGDWMRGDVHDPRAWALGGVAGHAGVFSTAADLARYCRMVLNKGTLDGRRVLSEATVAEMTRPRPVPGGGVRSYGFDVDTGYAVAPRGGRFGRGTTFGHTGFTGTMFWIDPAHDGFVVLLTNSVHPDGKGSVRSLRYGVATIAADALLGPRERVLCGIDVLKRDGFKQLKGRRVAVITNHTGVDRDGNRLIDLLAKAPSLTLVSIFSPEHGLYGKVDEKVGHAVDEKTGLKVHSLYGDTRRPTMEMLQGVDTLVFDIQDIGARFYTYISTMGLCMEEAARHKLRFVVLDRPNPNTGVLVDGPLAQKQHFGFTAYGPIPVAHGMTVGELATLFNKEFDINCKLDVVPMEHWDRRMWWDQTGVKWVDPSPNIRSPTQALLYLAVGLIEASNVSVGRGTDQPFEVFGAPWVAGREKELADVLNGAKLPGLSFAPTRFTPKFREFVGQECAGVKITLTDRNAFKPVRSGLTMAWHLRKLFGDQYRIEGVNKLLHNDPVMNALKNAAEPAKLPDVWKKELEAFERTRERYLMYR